MPNMITGAHVIIYSRKPEADRAFLRDVFRLKHVDAGDGWLIFALPPAELAVHPAEENNLHEFYFTCKDIGKFMAAMQEKGIACEAVKRLRWGMLTRIKLPGGGNLGVYQPLHVQPKRSRSKTRKGQK